MGPQERTIFIAFGYVTAFIALILCYFLYNIFKQQRKYRILQKAKLNAEINAAEIIRQNIATELHNDIGPYLSGIRMRMQQIQTEQKESLYECLHSLDKTVVQVRKMAKHLSPLGVFEMTFQEALKHYIHGVNVAGEIHVHFVELGSIQISPVQHSQIYRILQEIILNAIKHSGGTTLRIELSQEGDQILIRTADNGRGYDEAEIRANHQLGLGLLGIQSRIEYLNGTISHSEEIATGTKYNIRIPIVESEMLEKPIID